MSTSTWDRMLACVEAALARKASDLVVLPMTEYSSVADYFIICSARSDTQAQAIADAVEHRLRDDGVRPISIEGREHGQWILVDYGDVVLHVFFTPVRAFYDLERLWAHVPRLELPEPYQSQVRAQKTGTEND